MLLSVVVVVGSLADTDCVVKCRCGFKRKVVAVGTGSSNCGLNKRFLEDNMLLFLNCIRGRVEGMDDARSDTTKRYW